MISLRLPGTPASASPLCGKEPFPVLRERIEWPISMRERSLLQLCVAVAGIVPVAAGIAGIILGPEFVNAAVGAGADSHFRYLSGLLLGVGLGFWSTIPRIEANGESFRLLSFIVVAGGFARLISLAATGLPPFGMRAALAMELGVTPLLCLWQWQVGRQGRSSSERPQNGVDMRGQ